MSDSQQERISELEAKAKPKDELIIAENFVVNNIISVTIPLYTTSPGPEYKSNLSGILPKHLIDVNSNGATPIIQLVFYGDLRSINQGDRITACIQKYNIQDVKISPMGCSFNTKGPFYFERSFKEREVVALLGRFDPKFETMQYYWGLDTEGVEEY